jgi:hypothetical protein
MEASHPPVLSRLARALLSSGVLLLPLLRPSGEPMARSLNVKHEEKLGTSPLMNTFLALAAGWMLVGAFVANLAETAVITP